MTDGQSVSLSWCQALIWGPRPDFCYGQTMAGFLIWESSLARGQVCRLQLLLGLASAVILESESRGTHDHILFSDSRLLQSGGRVPLIYIPKEQGGSVLPLDTGFPFRRLLRLAGLRWRHSNPPPSRGQQQLKT
jgi:hypothetical protein